MESKSPWYWAGRMLHGKERDKMKNPVEWRSMASERFAVNLWAKFFGENTAGAGIVLNLSVSGALIETLVPVKTGDELKLRMAFPNPEGFLELPEVVVRWVQGPRFGVEFLRMDSHRFQ